MLKNMLISILGALVVAFILTSLVIIPILLYVATCSFAWGILSMILWIFGMKPIAMELVGLIVLFVMTIIGFKIFKSEVIDK